MEVTAFTIFFLGWHGLGLQIGGSPGALHFELSGWEGKSLDALQFVCIMGKHKKQKKHQGTLDSTVADGAVCAAVDDLWKCMSIMRQRSSIYPQFSLVLQNSSSDRLKVLWEEYDHIQDRIAGLRDLQRPGISNVTRRAEKMPFFEKWLQEYGAVYVDVCVLLFKLVSVAIFSQQLAIMETPDNGFGLRSTRELKVTRACQSDNSCLNCECTV